MKVMLKKIFNRKVAFLAAALLVLKSGITSLYAENWVNVNGTAPDNLEDSNYDKSHSGAIGKSSIAVGNKAIAEGDSSVAVGINVHNIGKTIKNNYGSYGATAIGMNNVNNGLGSTTIGYGETTIGNYNTAVGVMNDTAGKFNSVYGSSNDVKKNKSIVVGYRNANHGYGATVIGGENNTMFVNQFQATGKFAETADFGIAIGSSNTVLGSRSAGVGDANIVTGTHSYSFGGSTVNSGRESILIGTKSRVGNNETDYNHIGPKDDVQRVTLIGQYAVSAISDSVVLGSYSFASRDKGVNGYDPSTGKKITDLEILSKNNSNKDINQLKIKVAELNKLEKEYEKKYWEMDELRLKIQTGMYNNDVEEFNKKGAEFNKKLEELERMNENLNLKKKEVGDVIGNWKAQLAAVSVGNEEIGATRQITGVAAGTNDTDAVNVAQLKSLAEKPVIIANGGKVEKGHYSEGKTEAEIPLNKIAFDYGEGLKATKGTRSDGSEAVVVQIDREKFPDKEEVKQIVRENIEPVNKRIDRLEDRTSEGLAAVASMSVLDFNDAPVGKVGVGAGVGGYRNKQAVAVGVVYGVNENFKVNAKVGIPMNQYRNSAYGVSGTYYFNCD